jgi:hypothetical protein
MIATKAIGFKPETDTGDAQTFIAEVVLQRFLLLADEDGPVLNGRKR